MRAVIVIIFIASCFNLNAQEERKYKRKVSVDGTYLLSFFKTAEARLTPFNIKLSLNERFNFRTGFNINTSTSSNKGFEGDLKIGIDISHHYSKKWSYYYGADINGAYFNYNDRDNSTMILSFMPFLGFEVSNIHNVFALIPFSSKGSWSKVRCVMMLSFFLATS